MLYIYIVLLKSKYIKVEFSVPERILLWKFLAGKLDREQYQLRETNIMNKYGMFVFQNTSRNIF